MIILSVLIQFHFIIYNFIYLVGEDESEAVAAEEEDEEFERSMRDPGKKIILKKILKQPTLSIKNVLINCLTIFDKLLRFVNNLSNILAYMNYSRKV